MRYSWQETIVCGGREVEITSMDDFDQLDLPSHQFFDVIISVDGASYITSFLTLAYMKEWDQDGYSCYYPDESFVVIPKITKDAMRRAIAEIVGSNRITRFFEPCDEEENIRAYAIKRLSDAKSDIITRTSKPQDDEAVAVLERLKNWVSDEENTICPEKMGFDFWESLSSVLRECTLKAGQAPQSGRDT